MIKFRLLIAVSLLAACQSSRQADANRSDNSLLKKEEKQGWKLLFDGTSKQGWHVYNNKTNGSSWKVENGLLTLDPTIKGGGGDIATDEEFENFHFKIDWKVAPNGNSGVLFYVNEDSKFRYSYYTGPEMQVLDNSGHPDAKIIKHRAGDLYDLISASPETVKPAGEWNTAEIVSNNGKLEFHLNGTKVVSTTMWDDNWKAMLAGSKFKTMADFGTFKKGRIALQDHGDKVWYRNIMIRQL